MDSAGGTDGRYFAIDEQGRFSFREDSPPDFDDPDDAGRDNVYNVTVQASDDASNSATLDVTVTVTDHNESVEPTISTRRPPYHLQGERYGCSLYLPRHPIRKAWNHHHVVAYRH